jgi:hypothetical protein
MTDSSSTREERIASDNEVSIKSPATTAVVLLKKVPAPRPPKVEEEDPPNTAPMSPPLPVWSRITTIRNRQRRAWRTVIAICIKTILKLLNDFQVEIKNLQKKTAPKTKTGSLPDAVEFHKVLSEFYKLGK